MMLDKFDKDDLVEKSFELDSEIKSVESDEIQIIDDSFEEFSGVHISGSLFL